MILERKTILNSLNKKNKKKKKQNFETRKI